MQEHPIWDVDRIMIDMRICWTLIEYKNGMFHDIPIMKRALQNVHFTYILQDVIFYIFRVLHGCKYIYISNQSCDRISTPRYVTKKPTIFNDGFNLAMVRDP